MNLHLRVFFFFFSFFLISFLAVPISSGSVPPRGVAPEDEPHYDSGEVIKCRDGSKKFTRDQLNDDFCDCPDSTDEPGTSACPNGKFYCSNAGHFPLFIFSSRVNDGICDCCDGSDEYDGKVKCTNTCWEAGKVARNKLKKRIEMFKEGLSLRRQEVAEAKLALAKDEAELLKLKHEEKILEGLVQQLKNRKEQIEKAEEKERLQREKEEKEKKEAEEKSNQEKNESEKKFDHEKGGAQEKKSEQQEENTMESTDDNRIGLLEDSPVDQGAMEHYDDGAVEAEHSDHSENDGSLQNSVNQGKDQSEDTEELSREELGRRVASRWAGENTGQQTAKDGALKESDHEGHGETVGETNYTEDDNYASDTDDDHSYDDDNDIEDQTHDIVEDHDDSSSSYMSDSENDFDSSDIALSSNPTWLEKIQQTVRTILQAVNLFQTPVDKSEAAHVRKEYDESSAKLSKMQSRISSLTQKLKHDFGPDKEFYLFYGRCFESKQNKYVYKVCPFKQASQVEGHSTTELGQWEKFEDTYKVMLFSNGNKCWNGPDRSLKVKLRCGLKNELVDVDEPSRCEYEALLFTPAVCLEERLEELRQKLDARNKEKPQGHDEL